jgi:hypothetical protein
MNSTNITSNTAPINPLERPPQTTVMTLFEATQEKNLQHRGPLFRLNFKVNKFSSITSFSFQGRPLDYLPDGNRVTGKECYRIRFTPYYFTDSSGAISPATIHSTYLPPDQEVRDDAYYLDFPPNAFDWFAPLSNDLSSIQPKTIENNDKQNSSEIKSQRKTKSKNKTKNNKQQLPTINESLQHDQPSQAENIVQVDPIVPTSNRFEVLTQPIPVVQQIDSSPRPEKNTVKRGNTTNHREIKNKPNKQVQSSGQRPQSKIHKPNILVDGFSLNPVSSQNNSSKKTDSPKNSKTRAGIPRVYSHSTIYGHAYNKVGNSKTCTNCANNKNNQPRCGTVDLKIPNKTLHRLKTAVPSPNEQDNAHFNYYMLQSSVSNLYELVQLMKITIYGDSGKQFSHDELLAYAKISSDKVFQVNFFTLIKLLKITRFNYHTLSYMYDFHFPTTLVFDFIKGMSFNNVLFASIESKIYLPSFLPPKSRLNPNNKAIRTNVSHIRDEYNFIHQFTRGSGTDDSDSPTTSSSDTDSFVMYWEIDGELDRYIVDPNEANGDCGIKSLERLNEKCDLGLDLAYLPRKPVNFIELEQLVPDLCSKVDVMSTKGGNFNKTDLRKGTPKMIIEDAHWRPAWPSALDPEQCDKFTKGGASWKSEDALNMIQRGFQVKPNEFKAPDAPLDPTVPEPKPLPHPELHKENVVKAQLTSIVLPTAKINLGDLYADCVTNATNPMTDNHTNTLSAAQSIDLHSVSVSRNNEMTTEFTKTEDMMPPHQISKWKRLEATKNDKGVYTIGKKENFDKLPEVSIHNAVKINSSNEFSKTKLDLKPALTVQAQSHTTNVVDHLKVKTLADLIKLGTSSKDRTLAHVPEVAAALTRAIATMTTDETEPLLRRFLQVMTYDYVGQNINNLLSDQSLIVPTAEQPPRQIGADIFPCHALPDGEQRILRATFVSLETFIVSMTGRQQGQSSMQNAHFALMQPENFDVPLTTRQDRLNFMNRVFDQDISRILGRQNYLANLSQEKQYRLWANLVRFSKKFYWDGRPATPEDRDPPEDDEQGLDQQQPNSTNTSKDPDRDATQAAELHELMSKYRLQKWAYSWIIGTDPGARPSISDLPLTITNVLNNDDDIVYIPISKIEVNDKDALARKTIPLLPTPVVRIEHQVESEFSKSKYFKANKPDPQSPTGPVWIRHNLNTVVTGDKIPIVCYVVVDADTYKMARPPITYTFKPCSGPGQTPLPAATPSERPKYSFPVQLHCPTYQETEAVVIARDGVNVTEQRTAATTKDLNSPHYYDITDMIKEQFNQSNHHVALGDLNRELSRAEIETRNRVLTLVLSCYNTHTELSSSDHTGTTFAPKTTIIGYQHLQGGNKVDPNNKADNAPDFDCTEAYVKDTHTAVRTTFGYPTIQANMSITPANRDRAILTIPAFNSALQVLHEAGLGSFPTKLHDENSFINMTRYQWRLFFDKATMAVLQRKDEHYATLGHIVGFDTVTISDNIWYANAATNPHPLADRPDIQANVLRDREQLYFTNHNIDMLIREDCENMSIKVDLTATRLERNLYRLRLALGLQILVPRILPIKEQALTSPAELEPLSQKVEVCCVNNTNYNIVADVQHLADIAASLQNYDKPLLEFTTGNNTTFTRHPHYYYSSRAASYMTENRRRHLNIPDQRRFRRLCISGQITKIDLANHEPLKLIFTSNDRKLYNIAEIDAYYSKILHHNKWHRLETQFSKHRLGPILSTATPLHNRHTMLN